MPALFCDASAIVKRYASEVGSLWVIIDRAVSLVQAHGLRGYDADQLAAAHEVQADRLPLGLPPLTLCSADRALNTAAIAEGLAVDDPNTHS